VIYYLLPVFLFLDYVRPTSYYPALLPLHLNALAFWSLVIGTAATFGLAGREKIDANLKLLLALFGLVCVSVLTADVTRYAWSVARAVLEYTLLAWVITKHANDLKSIKRIFAAFVFIHIIVIALTPQLLFSGERQYLRSGAHLGDSNDFALSVNIVLPMCLFLLLEARNVLHRFFYATALLFLVISVAMTQSRGGTVGLICMGLYYWMKSDKKVVTGVLACAAVVAILALAPQGYFNRISTITSHEDGSAQGRILAWQGAMRMAADSPILGVGAGHFAVKYGAIYRTENVPWQTAHSVYFLALGELGIPGISVVLIFIGLNISRNARLRRRLKRAGSAEKSHGIRLLACSSASLIAFASSGAFLSALYYPHIFVLAGLLTASRNIAAQTEETEAVPVSKPREISTHWALRPPPVPRRIA
jgi:probable O-glycosylation ligase (exosortase A-associated)